MKVKILGTGSIYSKSNCAGILIDDKILVDIGPGVIKFLMREDFDLSKIDTIILTHLHFDHIVDLPLFLVYSNVSKFDHKIDVYGPEGTEERITNLCRLLNTRKTDRYIKDYLNFKVIEDGSNISVHSHDFKAALVKHGFIEAYCYLVDSKLGISGDSAMCESIKHLAKNSQKLICDCSHEVGNQDHMGIDNMEEILSFDDKVELIPVHYRDATREKLRTMQLPRVHVVNDGYAFEL